MTKRDICSEIFQECANLADKSLILGDKNKIQEIVNFNGPTRNQIFKSDVSGTINIYTKKRGLSQIIIYFCSL